MLKFGTSGLRGLVDELTDQECYFYTLAFLRYLSDKKLVKKNNAVAVAGDFRPSTKRILVATTRAIDDFGFRVDYCGIIPTPAVSLYGFRRRIPSIMVTGSHIPYDRNGIKFNLPTGEILKKDEQSITEYYKKIAADSDTAQLFDKRGSFVKSFGLPETNWIAQREYVERYLKFFKPNFLKNKKIVIYQHSAVIRDLAVEIFRKLGATVIPVGRSKKFVPIDTEAMRSTDLESAQLWSKKYRPDAIVSADGDSDRPMLFDETGNFIRGDFLGIICSSYLKADSVSVSASCNTALERSGKFRRINRTRIGSPYVIEAMQKDQKRGYKRVASYEANGGYLTQKNLKLNGRALKALPTRDSMLPILSALALAGENNSTLSELVKLFPQRFVYSASIKGIPTETSARLLFKLAKQDSAAEKLAVKLFGLPAKVRKFDFTDGARMFLVNEEIVHIRPSGNAPEIRVYVESDTLQKAQNLAESALVRIAKLVQ
ncbi:phosphomannomutase [Patescibacteria group bacterium]|nr:MAG: phosphomannomutase [Patescibacteria group bacterium]